MGAEAWRSGAQVVLVSGSRKSEGPGGVQLERVRSATEMARAMAQHAHGADAVVMAAAVADYMPEGGAASAKLAKNDGPLKLTFVRTPDILAELGKARGDSGSPLLLGFAAETGDPRQRARQQLASKRVDLIVANDVSREDAGLDTETNAAVFLSADAALAAPPRHTADIASQ